MKYRLMDISERKVRCSIKCHLPSHEVHLFFSKTFKTLNGVLHVDLYYCEICQAVIFSKRVESSNLVDETRSSSLEDYGNFR